MNMGVKETQSTAYPCSDPGGNAGCKHGAGPFDRLGDVRQSHKAKKSYGNHGNRGNQMWKLHRNPRKLWKPGNVRREKGFSSFFYNSPVSIISLVSCIVSPFGFPGFHSFLGFVYSFAILVSTCAGLGRAPTRKAPTGCGGRPPSPEEWQPATLPCPTVGRRASGSAAGVSQNKKDPRSLSLKRFVHDRLAARWRVGGRANLTIKNPVRDRGYVRHHRCVCYTQNVNHPARKKCRTCTSVQFVTN